ncbi:hypothetical protein NUACC21_44460 [Scytonema sp. NUACC21]
MVKYWYSHPNLKRAKLLINLPLTQSNEARDVLTQVHTACQSRSDSLPMKTGLADGGKVTKKLRNADGNRSPAAAPS